MTPLTPAQQRFDRLTEPRCVVCDQPFTPDDPKAGEASMGGHHGDAHKDCIDALWEEQ